MRFLADVGISPIKVTFLKGLGFDALHLHEQGLGRLQDSDTLDKAFQDGRAILTDDLDTPGAR